MTKDVLEDLKEKVEKNIEFIQGKIEACEKGRPPGVSEKDEVRNHHTLMRYIKLLMTIENRLSSLK